MYDAQKSPIAIVQIVLLMRENVSFQQIRLIEKWKPSSEGFCSA